MQQNADLIRKFYGAFQRRDAEGMVACYHPEVQFSDPVFPDLKGERAGAMWRMLCERGTDLKIEFRDVRATHRNGAVHWEAWYTFTGSGRKVHNVIDATFEFQDGRILRHSDRFDLHRWAGQALGLPGKLLGGTRFMQDKIRGMAKKNLDNYMLKALKA